MSHREALHKLFAIPPPTIEEIIAQENSRKNEDQVEEQPKPVKPSLKRAAENIIILEDSPSPEQQPTSMHVSKRLKTSNTKAKTSSVNNLKDPRLPQQPVVNKHVNKRLKTSTTKAKTSSVNNLKDPRLLQQIVVNKHVQPPTCSNKRKEFDLSDPEQKTCKKLKPIDTNIISKPTPTHKRPGKTTMPLPSSLGTTPTNKRPGKITMTPPSSLGTTPTTSPTSTTAPKEVFLIDKILAIIKSPPVTRFVSNSPPSPETAVAVSSMDRRSSAPTFLLPSPTHKSSASLPAHKSSASPTAHRSSASPTAHRSSASSPQTVTAGTASSSSMARTSSSPTIFLQSAHKSNAAPPISLGSIVPSRCSRSGLPPPPPPASTSAAPFKNIPTNKAPHQLSSATVSSLSTSVPNPALTPASHTRKTKPINPTPLKNVPTPEAPHQYSVAASSSLSSLVPTAALPPSSNNRQTKPIGQTPPKTAAPKLSNRAKKKIAWKNKKKKELAKKAAKRHVDEPKATDESDFDTLLKQFEEASSKLNTAENSTAKNSKSIIPTKQAAAAVTPSQNLPATKKAPVVKPPEKLK